MLDESYTINGITSDRILIFDIDDTLIYSNATINVVKNGEVVKTLSSAEFNHYVRKPGESFDFSNFDSEELLNDAKFTRYWDTLKREYEKGTHISILTARGRKTMIRRFFMQHGIEIKSNLVFCCGDAFFPYVGDIKYKKAKVIEHLHNLGYHTFVFFDDNADNLLMAKRMEKLYNINIITVKAEI